MGVVREFLCLAHGRFESTEAVCPRAGCTTVEQRHYTAPGIRSNRTAHADKVLDMVARDYGLTDMNNHGGTTAARVHSKQTRQALSMQEQLRAKFAPMNKKGGVYQVGRGPVNEGPGAPAAAAEYGAPPSNAVADVKESGALIPPKIVYTRDPENLQIAR